MDDDIVERLRGMTTGDRSDSWTVHLLPFDELHTALMDAADEIERLRVELNAWRRATKGAERLLDRARCEAKKERAEIERLRAEIETLRAALAIKDNHDHFDCTAEREVLRLERDRLQALIDAYAEASWEGTCPRVVMSNIDTTVPPGAPESWTLDSFRTTTPPPVEPPPATDLEQRVAALEVRVKANGLHLDHLANLATELEERIVKAGKTLLEEE